ncbi:MAG TPA: hypothetical protein VE756_09910 [Burkholderiales bacterium]|jgi:uncharacterized membrane protein YtjA (UPF0391 family)|nr:hypothetical protein [Burkholderiales bacterium]
MLSWALRFLIAAMVVVLIAHGDIGDGASLVLKIAVGVLLALCTVSLFAAYGRRRR